MPKRKTIVLIADDDLQLLDLVTLNLELEGYGVLRASDGRQALERFERHHPDLVLLDVMMPRMSGFAVCHQVRACSTVPIIIITARGQEQEKVRGLDLGADDYLVKPFSVGELLARVRAALRRTRLMEDERALRTAMTLGDLTIDFGQQLVLLSGRKVALTPTEYRLLADLARHAGRIVPQDLLLERVWGQEYVGEHHMLQVNKNRLRHKLEVDPAHPRYLLTEAGVGYLLVAPPQVQEAPEPAEGREP
ncbi:MAG: response regulator transcription factor [Ktedonobacteraceae bacterium]